MIADRCEINRQIRADNKMLQELKAKVAKLAEAVEKSIPIIAETQMLMYNDVLADQTFLIMPITSISLVLIFVSISFYVKGESQMQ